MRHLALVGLAALTAFALPACQEQELTRAEVDPLLYLDGRFCSANCA